MPIQEIAINASDLPESLKAGIEAAIMETLGELPGMDAPLAFEAALTLVSSGVQCTLSGGGEGMEIRRSAGGDDHKSAAILASCALKEVLEKHAGYLNRYGERTSVMELNILARSCNMGGEESLRRHFVKKLSTQDAMADLDLRDEPGMIFFNMDTGRASVMLNFRDGRFDILEPGFDKTGGAGVETTLTDLKLEPEQTGGKKEGAPAAKRAAGKLARFRQHLRCTACQGELTDREDELRCRACNRTYAVKDGVPVMMDDPRFDPEPRDSSVSKNPYGMQILKIIDKYKDGLVLDCGSGCPAVCFSNVVHLEIVKYPGVDIVASGERLPFADDSFDAVISEAVLEHVPYPATYLKELWRVLKPGGEVRVDAAFLQPYHGYPHHYFNMTLSGLELLMKDFKKIDCGAGPHQQPYVMLDQVLRAILEGIPDEEMKTRARDMTVGEILRVIEEEGEKGPFQTLTPEAVSRLAAGFYFYGYK